MLEIGGYDVTALELIDPEETPKNVLIRAIKRKNSDPQQIAKLKKEYKDICENFCIDPYLYEQYAK